MKFILFFVALALCHPTFDEWMAMYSRSYSSHEEYLERKVIYDSNCAHIDFLNNMPFETEFRINKFGDLSSQEFRDTYLSSVSPVLSESVGTFPEYKNLGDIPEAWDWRDYGAVTNVKNQGQCGSCWAFSTVGNIEGQWFLAGNDLTSLSEQNLVDCDHNCMNYEGENVCDSGCNGGLMPNALQYVIDQKGISTESAYPYQAYDGSCRFDPTQIGAKISNWTYVSHDEDQMAAFCYNNGPIAIAACATEWQFYFGGIFELPCCATLDHGILITGYDHQKNILGKDTPYWWIKNSWGSTWGIEGYIKVIRGKNKCHLADFPCSGIV